MLLIIPLCLSFKLLQNCTIIKLGNRCPHCNCGTCSSEKEPPLLALFLAKFAAFWRILRNAINNFEAYFHNLSNDVHNLSVAEETKK